MFPKWTQNGRKMCHEERHTLTLEKAHQGLDTRISEVHPCQVKVRGVLWYASCTCCRVQSVGVFTKTMSGQVLRTHRTTSSRCSSRFQIVLLVHDGDPMSPHDFVACPFSSSRGFPIAGFAFANLAVVQLCLFNISMRLWGGGRGGFPGSRLW